MTEQPGAVVLQRLPTGLEVELVCEQRGGPVRLVPLANHRAADGSRAAVEVGAQEYACLAPDNGETVSGNASVEVYRDGARLAPAEIVAQALEVWRSSPGVAVRVVLNHDSTGQPCPGYQGSWGGVPVVGRPVWPVTSEHSQELVAAVLGQTGACVRVYRQTGPGQWEHTEHPAPEQVPEVVEAESPEESTTDTPAPTPAQPCLPAQPRARAWGAVPEALAADWTEYRLPSGWKPVNTVGEHNPRQAERS